MVGKRVVGAMMLLASILLAPSGTAQESSKPLRWSVGTQLDEAGIRWTSVPASGLPYSAFDLKPTPWRCKTPPAKQTGGGGGSLTLSCSLEVGTVVVTTILACDAGESRTQLLRLSDIRVSTDATVYLRCEK